MAKKKLKSAIITLISNVGSAVAFTARDTVTEPYATYAIDAFKSGKDMKFKIGDDMYYVPFHAVDHIVVTETEETVEDKPTPYGC